MGFWAWDLQVKMMSGCCAVLCRAVPCVSNWFQSWWIFGMIERESNRLATDTVFLLGADFFCPPWSILCFITTYPLIHLIGSRKAPLIDPCSTACCGEIEDWSEAGRDVDEAGRILNSASSDLPEAIAIIPTLIFARLHYQFRGTRRTGLLWQMTRTTPGIYRDRIISN